MQKLECAICKVSLDPANLSKHIINKHSISQEEYYNSFIGNGNYKHPCPICGNERKFNSITKGYHQTCGNKECIYRLAQSKIKNTNLKKYGVENVFSSSEIRNRIRNTMIKRYGAPTSLESEEISRKIRKTMTDKFGCETPINNKEIKAKIEFTNLNKYGSIYPTQSNEVSLKISNKKAKNIKYMENRGYTNLYSLIEKYGQGWYNNLSYPSKTYKGVRYIPNDYINTIKEYSIHNTSKSVFEKMVTDYILELSPEEELVVNSRSILRNGLEIDIFLPRLNLAIECNGDYYHSSKFLNKEYHLNKTILCGERGIKLLHIFESEWKEKRSACKSIISKNLNKTKNKIPSSNIFYKKADKDDLLEFFKDNSLDEIDYKSSLDGYYFDDKLVLVVATVNSEIKLAIKNDYEIEDLSKFLLEYYKDKILLLSRDFYQKQDFSDFPYSYDSPKARSYKDTNFSIFNSGILKILLL